MLENVTNDTQCDWYANAGYNIFIFNNFVLMPIIAIFGNLGNVCFLMAFLKEMGQEAAFGYQVYVVICKLLLFVIIIQYQCTYALWTGTKTATKASMLYKSCYPCMWYGAHFAVPIANMVFTFSFALTIATVAERVFALGKPLTYRNINHKKHQILAVTTCSIIAISINAYDCFRLYPDLGPDDLYFFDTNLEFTESILAKSLSHVRNAVRLMAVLILIVLNCTMIVLYRKYALKSQMMSSLDSVNAQKRRDQARILSLSAVNQSIVNVITITVLSILYTVYYLRPSFYSCADPFYAPLTNTCIGLCQLGDFYVIFLFSKQFRMMIVKNVPVLRKIWTRFSSTRVQVVRIGLEPG